MGNKQEFICSIDADLLERFKGIVVLNKQEVPEVIERLMSNYIADSLEGFYKPIRRVL